MSHPEEEALGLLLNAAVVTCSEQETTLRILVCGSTGTGKSALCNYLYNCNSLSEGQPFHPAWSMASVTQKVEVSTFSSTDLSEVGNDKLSRFNVEIIDTPGLNEEDWLRDLQHIHNIYENVLSKYSSVNLIVLCVDAARGDNQATATLSYFLNLFGYALPNQRLFVAFTKLSTEDYKPWRRGQGWETRCKQIEAFMTRIAGRVIPYDFFCSVPPTSGEGFYEEFSNFIAFKRKYAHLLDDPRTVELPESLHVYSLLSRTHLFSHARTDVLKLADVAVPYLYSLPPNLNARRNVLLAKFDSEELRILRALDAQGNIEKTNKIKKYQDIIRTLQDKINVCNQQDYDWIPPIPEKPSIATITRGHTHVKLLIPPSVAYSIVPSEAEKLVIEKVEVKKPGSDKLTRPYASARVTVRWLDGHSRWGFLAASDAATVELKVTVRGHLMALPEVQEAEQELEHYRAGLIRLLEQVGAAGAEQLLRDTSKVYGFYAQAQFNLSDTEALWDCFQAVEKQIEGKNAEFVLPTLLRMRGLEASANLATNYLSRPEPRPAAQLEPPPTLETPGNAAIPPAKQLPAKLAALPPKRGKEARKLPTLPSQKPVAAAATPLESFLAGLGLSSLNAALAAQHLDSPEELKDLSDNDWEKLGVTIGDRNKIRRALK